MRDFVEKALPFQCEEHTIPELKEMFKYNPFKLYLLNKFEAEGTTKATTYTCGPFTDLCRGPHVSDTGLCKLFHITKVTEASFNVSPTETKPVQRVYGVCFENEEQEKDYFKRLEFQEHQKIGAVCISSSIV